MKILKLHPDGDYESLAFENCYHGTPVSDVIKRVEAGEKILVTDDNGDDATFTAYLKVYEVGEIGQDFLKFVRNEIQDEDDRKHANFYVEGETI